MHAVLNCNAANFISGVEDEIVMHAPGRCGDAVRIADDAPLNCVICNLDCMNAVISWMHAGDRLYARRFVAMLGMERLMRGDERRIVALGRERDAVGIADAGVERNSLADQQGNGRDIFGMRWRERESTGHFQGSDDVVLGSRRARVALFGGESRSAGLRGGGDAVEQGSGLGLSGLQLLLRDMHEGGQAAGGAQDGFGWVLRVDFAAELVGEADEFLDVAEGQADGGEVAG